MESMDSGQRSKAIIYSEAPADIITFNSSQASLPEEAGIPATQLNGTQREVLTALVTDYVMKARADLAQERLDNLLHDGGLDKIYVAWGGLSTPASPTTTGFTAATSSSNTTTARTAPTTSTPSGATSRTTSPTTSSAST